MTRLLYRSYAENRVKTRQAVRDAKPCNCEFIDFNEDKSLITNMLTSGCDIILSHDHEMRRDFLGIKHPVIAANNEWKPKIAIAFSGDGVDLLPNKFSHVDANNKICLIYGFGLRRPASEVFPTNDGWRHLLQWAAELSQLVKSKDVNISQIVADMPPKVRQLLDPPPVYPETLVAAYLLLVANSKNVNVSLNTLSNEQWKKAGKEYEESGGKYKGMNWNVSAQYSIEEQTILKTNLKTHFSNMAARL
jgi:hypothetical protein